MFTKLVTSDDYEYNNTPNIDLGNLLIDFVGILVNAKFHQDRSSCCALKDQDPNQNVPEKADFPFKGARVTQQI